jgi:hypothetical protein
VVSNTKTFSRRVHPQISQISADDFNPGACLICENLRNLWINLFVNDHHVAKELRFGTDRTRRVAHKFKLFVLQKNGRRFGKKGLPTCAIADVRRRLFAISNFGLQGLFDHRQHQL